MQTQSEVQILPKPGFVEIESISEWIQKRIKHVEIIELTIKCRLIKLTDMHDPTVSIS